MNSVRGLKWIDICLTESGYAVLLMEGTTYADNRLSDILKDDLRRDILQNRHKWEIEHMAVVYTCMDR